MHDWNGGAMQISFSARLMFSWILRLGRGLVPIVALFALLLAGWHDSVSAQPAADIQRRLYVAVPGIRNYLEYGGHGVLVFDIDDQHTLIKRIPMGGLRPDGSPLNVKGVCASAATGRLYVSTLETLISIDLLAERQLWERHYEGGCDRMSISPDGQTIYLPSLEKDHWHVIDALSGDSLATIVPKSGAHNTVYGRDGSRVYLAGLRSPWLTVAETATHTAERRVGPFSHNIRPFTVNGRQTLCFVTINELLGFEVGDLVTGQLLHRVEVEGYEQGKVKRHGCPSHGIGLTPDEREVWVCDAHNQSLHVFDATQMPPVQLESIRLKDEPGWITFSLDGTLAYPSTGDVIDVATRQIITELKDENGVAVQSEKMVEIHFSGSQPMAAGDQFGVGPGHPLSGTTSRRDWSRQSSEDCFD